jgi:hypothetical protein
MSSVTIAAKKLLEQITSWPTEDQEELVQYARQIEARRTGVYRLSDSEKAGIERGLAAMRARDFASDGEVAAVLQSARARRK